MVRGSVVRRALLGAAVASTLCLEASLAFRTPGVTTMALKGFGAGSSKKKSNKSKSKSKSTEVPFKIDRTKELLSFYDYLDMKGSSYDKVGIATFDVGFDLRGVVALKDIKKGDTIISIPAPAAVDLGTDSTDPTGPAMTLLRAMRRAEEKQTPLMSYFRLLPAKDSNDVLGATDFWPDNALDAPGLEEIATETRQRRQRVASRLEQEGEGFTQEDLTWATWIISSRVLTVQGELGQERKLLIPFIDMCNHERGSAQILSGRATGDGRLKVIAGKNIKEGEQVTITYGGPNTGNDRFMQDYGFLDRSAVAYDNVISSMDEATRGALEGTLKVATEAAAGSSVPESVTREYQLGLMRALERARR